MRIVLYAAVSRRSVDEVFEQDALTAFRRWARRLVNRLAWRFFDRFQAHPYHYYRKRYSNYGDEAIRFTIERQLRTVLPDDLEFEDMAWGRLDRQSMDRYGDGNTVIVVTGGGYYRFSDNGDLHPSVAEEIVLLSQARCPVVSYGAGVNFNILPDGPSEFRPTAKAGEILTEHFRHVAYCAVRDQFSKDLMQPYSTRPIDVIADPVFFLEPMPPLEPPGDVLRVGVNMAFHGPNAMAVLAVWIHAFRDLLKSIQARHKARFVYFVHSDVEQGVVALLRDSGIDFEIVERDPEALAQAYAKIDVHICQMMHSSIMSTRLAVPTLVVAYDRKHYSFFELLGLEKFCIPVEEASLPNLTRLFDELVARRQEIRAEILARREVLRQAQGKALKAIASIAAEVDATRQAR